MKRVKEEPVLKNSIELIISLIKRYLTLKKLDGMNKFDTLKPKFKILTNWKKELEKKINSLEKKLAKTKTADKKLVKEEVRLVADEKKLKKVLKVLDDLLGQLPDEIIEKFVQSKDFKLYEALMDELGL